MTANCAECARLAREKEAARKSGDLSKVTDCSVLLRRHPDHGKRGAYAGKGRAEHITRPYRFEAGAWQ